MKLGRHMQPHKRTQSGPLSRNEYETSQSGLLASFGGAGLSALQRSSRPPLLVAHSTSVNLALPLLADENSISPSTNPAQNKTGASLSFFWGRRSRRVLEARENTTRSHSMKPGVRDTKTALQQARSMVHGNKPATHEGFEPGRIPDVPLGLICSRDRHAFHPRSFRTFSLLTTSHEHLLYLSQRLEHLLFRYIRRKKTIMPRSRRLSSFAPAHKI